MVSIRLSLDYLYFRSRAKLSEKYYLIDRDFPSICRGLSVIFFRKFVEKMNLRREDAMAMTAAMFEQLHFSLSFSLSYSLSSSSLPSSFILDQFRNEHIL